MSFSSILLVKIILNGLKKHSRFPCKEMHKLPKNIEIYSFHLVKVSKVSEWDTYDTWPKVSKID